MQINSNARDKNSSSNPTTPGVESQRSDSFFGYGQKGRGVARIIRSQLETELWELGGIIQTSTIKSQGLCGETAWTVVKALRLLTLASRRYSLQIHHSKANGRPGVCRCCYESSTL